LSEFIALSLDWLLLNPIIAQHIDTSLNVQYKWRRRVGIAWNVFKYASSALFLLLDLGSGILGEGAVCALDDAHDHSEQPQCAPEDLHYQDLHEGVRVLRIGDRAPAPRHSHADSE